MSSILKVDQLQDSGGNAIITSDGSGNLTAGTIPSTVIGTGALIKVQSTKNDGSVNTTTSTSYVDTVSTANYTPVLSNSKLFVTVDHCVAITAGSSHQRCDIRLIETVTSTVLGDLRYVGKDGNGGTQTMRPMTLSGLFTNSTSAQKTFKVQVRKANGSASEANTIYHSWYAGADFYMTIMEIAG